MTSAGCVARAGVRGALGQRERAAVLRAFARGVPVRAGGCPRGSAQG